ncbi:hypothetical protein SASPL_151755 [Salvia splendens]|uniref:Uncharacterized protein n=1 Tax=Salvia splendens TaxID=180675 RepID=A0A8X8W293_SALSN|nr:hypothetical protein SASPL_151755 [Salvia splendens]
MQNPLNWPAGVIAANSMYRIAQTIFPLPQAPARVDLNNVQDSLDSTMPWIGMYIAAASGVCTLAMVADAFIGFRSKKYWLPCKYFSLNAFSLTLLAVAMKLPVDLTSLETTSKEKLTRISSVVLMSTAMSNFMTSLGAMENTEIVLNMAALGILVITIAGNISIHLVQMRTFPSMSYALLPQQVTSAVIMLLFFVMLCCMSLMVPEAKRYIGLKYNEMHKSVSNGHVEWGRFSSDEVENSTFLIYFHVVICIEYKCKIRVIAANSMYRIAHTILLGMGDGENQTDNELFVSISITISDILAACLTNLVQVITLKCHRSDIKEREESVRRAAILLGESKEIFDILQQRELPCLDVEKAANFDEWRASLELDIENPLASSSPSSSDNSTTV